MSCEPLRVTVKTRVQSQASPCVTNGGQSGTGTSLPPPPVLPISLASIISELLHFAITIICNQKPFNLIYSQCRCKQHTKGLYSMRY